MSQIMSRQHFIIYDKAEISHCLKEICERYEQTYARLERKFERVSTSTERRGDDRHQIEIPFFLHPVQLINEGHLEFLTDEAEMALTRDVSSQGIGFQVDAPFESSHAIAEFDGGEDQPVQLLIEIRWHQKKAFRFYIAGAVVMGIVRTA